MRAYQARGSITDCISELNSETCSVATFVTNDDGVIYYFYSMYCVLRSAGKLSEEKWLFLQRP